MKVNEKNINKVVETLKDNIDVEFDSKTDLSYAFQIVIEWLEEGLIK